MSSTDVNDKKIFWTLFIFVFIYYGINCPPRITVEDSGDFIMGLSSLGIVHGPSFPLFTMLGFLFSKIPIGELGFRLALYSSLFGALGISLFYWLLRLLGITKTSAVLSALAVSLTSIFMGQSIIVEVYSLNIVFILLLYIFTLYTNNIPSKKNLFFMGLITASGLIHHYPLFILGSVGLLFVFKWKQCNKNNLSWGILGFILGLVPFTYLLIQMTNQNLEYNFGKVANWEMLWKQFLRKGYSGVDNAGGGLSDKLSLSYYIFKQLLLDFKLIFLLFPFGVYLSFKNKESRFISISFLTSSILVVFLLGFKHSEQYQAVIKAYLMPAAVFAGFFMALALDKILVKNSLKYLFIGLTLINGATNFKDTSHINDRLVYEWARNGLESLEPNSILILCGQEPYALYYVNKFLKVRPDVTIYDRLSIMTKENLYHPELLFWKVKTKKKFEQLRDAAERKLIQSSKRPIYTTCIEKFEKKGYKLAQTIYFNRILNHIPFVPTKSSQVLSTDLLTAAVTGYPKSEYWIDSLRNMILFNSFKYYLINNEQMISPFLHELRKHKNSKDIQFIHSILEQAYRLKKNKRYKEVFKWAKDNLNGAPLHHASYGRLCTILAVEKNYEAALSNCLISLKEGPDCNTSIMNNLLFITYNSKKLNEAKKWALNILECKPGHSGANSFLNSIK